MELPKSLQQNKSKLQKLLLDWYAANRRDFPWRNTNNPFEVLLAEKLLQQTKARNIVVVIYTDLLAKYPTPQALVNAKEEELRKMIQPLGLVYRASEIIQMATEIVELYSGEVPSNLEDLLSLTGVGDYGARAVLSFAYNQNVPIVDTNVARFLHRLCGIDDPLPTNPARKKYLLDLASELLVENRARDFNFAILDFCAAVCEPRVPQCHMCVLRKICTYSV